MRVLLRGWAPLPLSALVLSSLRGTTRRATTRAGEVRLSSRIAGSGGVHDVGGDKRSEHSGEPDGPAKVPLVQQIYDELRIMRDPLVEARKGGDSPVLAKVMRLMDALQPQDLGISEQKFEGLAQSLSMPILVGRNPADQDTDARFDLAIFVLPAGGRIPMHDHPRMTVLSRVLFGSLEVESYDLVAEEVVDPGEAAGQDLRRPRGFMPRPSAALVEGGPRRQSHARRWQARMKARGTADARSPSFVLTPTSGNVHAFRAPVACAIFDVLVPPYDPSEGRSCSYFRVVDPPTRKRPRTSKETRRKGRDGAESPGSHGGSLATNAQPPGEQREPARESRVVLEEIPEPAGLPRWYPYPGPKLVAASGRDGS